jgi:hypothetical protein
VTSVLTVFIDGLKPDSLKYMPFINSLQEKRRIRTELGYSTTCHASMYTGVLPSKHLVWFIWKYAPGTSPFAWIGKLRADRLPDSIYCKYICYRITRLFSRHNSSFFGIPFLWNLPMRAWAYLDVAEKKFWTQSGYSEHYETIFELLGKRRIEYDIVGMPANPSESDRIMAGGNKAAQEFNPGRIKPWTYLFIGDIDPLSHLYGQDSSEVQTALKDIDAILETKYRLFQEQDRDFVFMLFSDHGHTNVTVKIDLFSFFESCGRHLNDHLYFIDSNFARFWFKADREKREVEDVLLRLGDKGFVLTADLQKKYCVDMPDNRYGDLIYYLDAPNVFDKGDVMAFGKKRNHPMTSAHGYLPGHPNSDGILVSNKPLASEPYIVLQDILPSILCLLGVPVPEHAEGRIFWK